ncbi:hypothetical protein [Mycolicibacterium fortuitum]|uniref:hypothetical protein n=1 Tax=Mycolicibacterium fortuitum TaxID=1766 RepID=UPI0026326DC5|nr:hypothetical protein [Mycolicibacterium fortuitum]
MSDSAELEPTSTHRCTVGELVDLWPRPGLVIRASDDGAAPWKLVDTIHDEWYWEPMPDRDPVRVDVATVDFCDGTTRFLGAHVNEVDIGIVG